MACAPGSVPYSHQAAASHALEYWLEPGHQQPAVQAAYPEYTAFDGNSNVLHPSHHQYDYPIDPTNLGGTELFQPEEIFQLDQPLRPSEVNYNPLETSSTMLNHCFDQHQQQQSQITPSTTPPTLLELGNTSTIKQDPYESSTSWLNHRSDHHHHLLMMSNNENHHYERQQQQQQHCHPTMSRYNDDVLRLHAEEPMLLSSAEEDDSLATIPCEEARMIGVGLHGSMYNSTTSDCALLGDRMIPQPPPVSQSESMISHHHHSYSTSESNNICLPTSNEHHFHFHDSISRHLHH